MPKERREAFGKAQRALLATMRLGANAHEASELLAAHDREIERILRITEVLWSLLKEKHGYSDGDLIERLAKAEQRAEPPGHTRPAVCPTCRSTIARMHKRCPYCGQAILHNPFVR